MVENGGQARKKIALCIWVRFIRTDDAKHNKNENCNENGRKNGENSNSNEYFKIK